jgi:hypothetical protein
MMICESFAMRGFNIDIAAAHLVIRDVPHVRHGILVSSLNLSGDLVMPSAKSPPVKRRRQIGSWGGRRNGAGRKRELGLSDRREIAGDYFDGMQKRRNNRPLREALIRKLMAEYNVTHRTEPRRGRGWNLGDFSDTFAAAPPTSVMNSRLFTQSPRRRGRAASRPWSRSPSLAAAIICFASIARTNSTLSSGYLTRLA